MDQEILSKILDNPFPFIGIVVIGTTALCIIGRGITDFLNQLIKIIKTLGEELSGRSKAKSAAMMNTLLLIIVAVLIFLIITPSLLSQLGFSELNTNTGSYVALIFIFCLTAYFSGHFILKFSTEANAFKDRPKKPKEHL